MNNKNNGGQLSSNCIIMLLPKYFILVCFIIAILSVLIIGNFPVSFAHPFFVDSSPKPFQSSSASPAQVQVFFSEPMN
jgi:hypothetical protein